MATITAFSGKRDALINNSIYISAVMCYYKDVPRPLHSPRYTTTTKREIPGPVRRGIFRVGTAFNGNHM